MTFTYQPALRPALPCVYGPLEYREQRALFERIDTVLSAIMLGIENAASENKFDDFFELQCRKESQVHVEFADEALSEKQAAGDWHRQAEAVAVVAGSEDGIRIVRRHGKHREHRNSCVKIQQDIPVSTFGGAL